jgi:voltage-gated potassium channel Kch
MEISEMITPSDPLQEKYVALLATLMAIVYTTMCSYQYTEMMFAEQIFSISESLYATIVTLSTVGYGDIVPKSVQGRFVIIFAILVRLHMSFHIASKFRFYTS